ncbi:FadR/GntR family transcriptional regulator [Gardnerella vaginalis]|jgi:hypothetical protein|nr:HTH-type transcriptional regulator LutR [Gardnerella vaginalis]CRH64768.1 L-lactate utilization operon repressor [Chlamydia trachomatis]
MNEIDDLETMSIKSVIASIATLSDYQNHKNNPTAPISRCDETINAIKSYILRKHLKPDDALPGEVQLCNQICTSRSSIREAIRKLEALNIVRVEHGKGTFIGSLSLSPMVETLAFRALISADKNLIDLQNVVEMRKFLDIGCAEEVVKSLAGTEQSNLFEIVNKMSKYAAQGKTFMQLDIDFHMGVLSQLNNNVAKQMVKSFWLVHMAVLPQLRIPVSAEIEQTADAHKDILKAAIAGDVNAYRQAIIKHYEPIESILRCENTQD